MISTPWKKQLKKNTLEIIESKKLPACSYDFPKLRENLSTDVELAKIGLVHFDHIQGESEIDREQIFSNLLKAANYFGLNIEKVDFHRQD